MFERIMEHLNFSGTSASPGYSVDEKIHMLEFVLHHPLVAGVNEKTRGQLSPTLFTLKDKAMNCMQLAVRAQIDTLNAELGKKIVLP